MPTSFRCTVLVLCNDNKFESNLISGGWALILTVICLFCLCVCVCVCVRAHLHVLNRSLLVLVRSFTSSTSTPCLSCPAHLLNCRYDLRCRFSVVKWLSIGKSVVEAACASFDTGMGLCLIYLTDTRVRCSLPRRPLPCLWSSSPTPASSRAPGPPSSGSTCFLTTPRWGAALATRIPSPHVPPLRIRGGTMTHVFVP